MRDLRTEDAELESAMLSSDGKLNVESFQTKAGLAKYVDSIVVGK